MLAINGLPEERIQAEARRKLAGGKKRESRRYDPPTYLAGSTRGHQLRVEFGHGGAEDGCRGGRPSMQSFRIWSS